MTVAMELLRRRPDGSRRCAFPPRRVAMGLARQAGIRRRLGATQRTAMTWLGHLAYGTTAGMLLPVLKSPPRCTLMTGLVYGVGLWILSYAGWLPAARVLEPPARRPAQENFIIVAGHLVWGATLARLAAGLGRCRS